MAMADHSALKERLRAEQLELRERVVADCALGGRFPESELQVAAVDISFDKAEGVTGAVAFLIVVQLTPASFGGDGSGGSSGSGPATGYGDAASKKRSKKRDRSLLGTTSAGYELRFVYEDFVRNDDPDCTDCVNALPYLPGFLGFREVPLYVRLFDRLARRREDDPTTYARVRPDVVLVDGNGTLHPVRFGVACHLGVLIDLPAVGVAKNLHCVDGLTKEDVLAGLAAKEDPEKDGKEGGEPHGATASDGTLPLVGRSGGTLGAAFLNPHVSKNVRLKKPVYVSTGHRISLEAAVEIVRRTTLKDMRLSEPCRLADVRGRERVRELFDGKTADGRE